MGRTMRPSPVLSRAGCRWWPRSSSAGVCKAGAPCPRHRPLTLIGAPSPSHPGDDSQPAPFDGVGWTGFPGTPGEGYMTETSRNARIVGFWYLMLVFVGPLRLLYIPGKLFVQGDADASAANILAHPTLFQLGIFADSYGGVLLVILTLAFHRLFK